VEELKMFREMADGMEEDKAASDAKVGETQKLLQQAVQDIIYLTSRNAELEKQLKTAAAWEP
jgi:hypothetical protein